MNIIPDLSFSLTNLVLWNALPFLVALFGMYRIIFKPMLGYLEERDAAITEGKDEAGRIEERISARMKDYDSMLEQAKSDVTALRANRREEAQTAYDAVVARARQTADAMVKDAVREISTASDATAAELRTQADLLAQQVAGQVLGREVAAG